MNLDIVSYLMGKSGGGGESGSDLAVWNGGFFYDPAGANNRTQLNVPVTDFNGKYAFITVMHRNDITAPSDCTLLDKSTYTDEGITQYVSIFKAHIDSNNKNYQFSQSSYGRINASVWIIESDYALEKSDTIEFQYFKEKGQLKTTAQTFFVFSATQAQTAIQNCNVVAVAPGAWLNQSFSGAYYVPDNDNWANGYTYQVRHFSGMISSSKTEKTTEINQIPLANFGAVFATYTQKAQVVAYTITV